MKNYIVYNKNGEILRTGVCPDAMVELQAHGNERVMEGAANDFEHKIAEGKIIRKTEEEIERAKEKMKPDAQEQRIQKKANEILRKMAIEELEKEGNQ